MSKNKSNSFFKFQNVQIVRRPDAARQTRQNTQIQTNQATAEEQFAAITAAAQAEALRVVDDLLSDDDDSVDYSPPRQTTAEVDVHPPATAPPDTVEASTSSPESATDSSLDTASIEVIDHNSEELQIRRPENPPQRLPPIETFLPISPRSNVAADISGLLTEDEGPDQVVPPTIYPAPLESQGRKETLSPTPNRPNTVRSAIELAVTDLEASEQRLCDKCGEVDFQLSNHDDWKEPHRGLRNDLCELIPQLFETGFNTDGFPNLERYLLATVGSLPYQPLIRLALDAIFEEFPEISAVQNKVYRMLKCHLSVLNHPSVQQFQDIDLSNHDFDRVVGVDFHNVAGSDSRPDLSINVDLNETFYSVYSQAQRQAFRVTERSFGQLAKNKTRSCPDIASPVDREFEDLTNSNWQYTTARDFIPPLPPYPKTDRIIQTDPVRVLRLVQTTNTGAQCNLPPDDSGGSSSSSTSSSDSEGDFEGTENITVAKRYHNREYSSEEDIHTVPTPPHKRFRTSTPEQDDRQPAREPDRCPLKEIINHRPALEVPEVDIIVAPGGRGAGANIQLGAQRVNAAMAAGRGRQRVPNLQGADPALVQILQMMQNRDANRDNSRKQLLMFPTEKFTGTEKSKAQGHWAEFSKYLDYQVQLGTIQRNQAQLPEIKSMFKLTLQGIALGWFETESPTWLTEEQMKQEFLKRFNPWGDTRRQQQDAWNKLKFDMNKDDVDAFVVNMKMLASILGLDEEATREKFKDIFPDPNIEAALIAMEDFAAMQAKAKQLVQIYKPTHISTMASATLLSHTVPDTKPDPKPPQPQINQHQLSPTNPTSQEGQAAGNGDEYRGNYRGRGRGRGSRGRGGNRNSEGRDDRGGNRGEYKQNYNDNRGQDQENSSRGRRKRWDNNNDNRDRGGDGQGNGRGKKWDKGRGQGSGDRGRGRRWIPHEQYPPPGYVPPPHYQDPNHYRPPPMGYQAPYPQGPPQYPVYPPQQQQQYPVSRPPARSQQATNVCQLCQNAGHFDYQCQFASEFVTRTQKAFNHGRSYNHTDPGQQEWADGEDDNENPNDQPFQ